MKVKSTGIIIIIFCCWGSLVGVIFCCSHMVTPMNSGRMFSPNGRTSLNRFSGVERSAIHRNEEKRSSMAPRSTTNRAKNTGIWISMGRQPPIGLILCSL